MRRATRIAGGALTGALVATGAVLATAAPASAQAEPCVQRVAVVNNPAS
jgi:hypothetical protein